MENNSRDIFDYISLLAPVISSLAAVGALLLAWGGLSTWKKQSKATIWKEMLRKMQDIWIELGEARSECHELHPSAPNFEASYPMFKGDVKIITKTIPGFYEQLEKISLMSKNLSAIKSKFVNTKIEGDIAGMKGADTYFHGTECNLSNTIKMVLAIENIVLSRCIKYNSRENGATDTLEEDNGVVFEIKAEDIEIEYQQLIDEKEEDDNQFNKWIGDRYSEII